MRKFLVSFAVFVLMAVMSMTVAFAFTTITIGSKGANVKKVQTVLKNHNLNATVDGSFGAGTAKLVKLYQKMHHLKADGKVGEETWNFMMDKINYDKERLTQPTTTLPLIQNSKGKDVEFVQKILKSHKYPVKVDGKYGASTVKYVKLYQKAHFLNVDGKVGADTWESMSASYKILPYTFPKADIQLTKSRFPVNENSSAADIQKVQKALAEKKINESLAADGVYNAATIQAVKAFQASKGMEQTGTVNMACWEALVATEQDNANVMNIARVVSLESGGANDYEHLAIANVVIDAAAKWNRSIESEIRSGRYSVANNWTSFLKKTPGSRCIANAKRAYYGDESVFGGGKAYYFHIKSFIPAPGSWWKNQKRYGLIDRHVFYGS